MSEITRRGMLGSLLALPFVGAVVRETTKMGAALGEGGGFIVPAHLADRIVHLTEVYDIDELSRPGMRVYWTTPSSSSKKVAEWRGVPTPVSGGRKFTCSGTFKTDEVIQFVIDPKNK